MSDKPPKIRKAAVITAVLPRESGSLRVEWDLDRFFLDPKWPDKVYEPDEIRVSIPDDISPPLQGSTRHFEIPAAVIERYAGLPLVGHVVFKWAGPPDEVLQSAFLYHVPGTGLGGGQLTQGPSVPTLRLVSRHPKTIAHENRITISWSSYSLTHGKITWGPSDDPQRHVHEWKQRGTRYAGEFTTDHPLAPRVQYQFLVSVRNAFHNTTAEAAITVGSVDNFRSVRQFLTASGVPLPAHLRPHMRGQRSVRAWMGV